jgi:hypothetical protein
MGFLITDNRIQFRIDRLSFTVTFIVLKPEYLAVKGAGRLTNIQDWNLAVWRHKVRESLKQYDFLLGAALLQIYTINNMKTVWINNSSKPNESRQL